jgi:hypothetical protein
VPVGWMEGNVKDWHDQTVLFDRIEAHSLS